MDAKFEKLRTQVNSKLENQKLYARTLLAIEETIREQGGNLAPTSYFGAILSTLQSVGPENDVTGALLYLMSDVLPELPAGVLASKCDVVLPILEQTYASQQNEQPIVRSIIGCLQELLAHLDAAAWSMPPPKRAYRLLLTLSATASPKARKASQDAVKNILSRVPPPNLVHPAANMTADFVMKVLNETTKSDQHATQQILVLVRRIIHQWPQNKFAVLCHVLLQLPEYNNVFLTKSTFEVFEALFDAQDTDIDEEKFMALLKAIYDMKPAAIDDNLYPTWLLIVSKAYPALAKMNPSASANIVAPVFTLIFADFKEESRCHRVMADCLSKLIDLCVTEDMITEVCQGGANGLNQIVAALEEGLGIFYQRAWQHIMVVQQSLFRRLYHNASPLMNNIVSMLGELRLSPAGAYKEELDKTLGAAIATMGPANFLSILPLNLESPNSSSDVGRAFLLPLLKAYTTNTTLGYFVEQLIPLADRLGERAQAANARGLSVQVKVYETLVNQIWNLAPGFCDLPLDLSSAFNDSVAERFSQILYSEPELRAVMAKSLQYLVEKNKTLSQSSANDEDLRKAYGVTVPEAKHNIQHMSKFANNYLAVFFNVYSQAPTASRGYMANTIASYLSIASTSDVNSTFQKVLGLLSQALEQPTGPVSNDPTVPPPMSHTMLDLSAIMVPFLDVESAKLLYNGTVTTLLPKEDEPTLQKKGYKILCHLMGCPVGQQVIRDNVADVQEKLLAATATCSVAARKDRIRALLAFIPLLPTDSLHFIPSIVSEVVISCKDSNEKTRTFAFLLLVCMGEKMKEGGIVKNSLLEGMDDSAPDAHANISEYFTMVTAGLAGTTAHMIAATITALSRIFYEFKDDLAPDLALELLQAINVFVASTNREIVRSALGYVKVCLVSLHDDVVTAELPSIVENLIQCSHQTRNQFKVKIRHLFERLIRRFGFEQVNALVPEDDKKLVANIQKRRLRAKRKKADAGEEEGEEEEMQDTRQSAAKNVGGQDAYEEVLYGSDSELDDSDNEMIQNVKSALNKKQGKKDKTDGLTYIREGEDDNPLDFLDRSALGRITSAKPKQLKNKSLAKGAKFDEEGKLIINEHDGESDSEDSEEEEEDYFMQAQKSADGFIRTERNKIKFKKAGKHGNDDDAMDLDEEGGAGRRKKKSPKERYEMIGKEFRSKKAKGDVKSKNKADPYAYMPLGKVIKKKGRPTGAKVTFTGRVRR